METISKAKDLGNYYASKQSDEALREDWKTVNKWYATGKGGEKEGLSGKRVDDLAAEILGELICRRNTKFHPKDMKPSELELFTQSLVTVLALEKLGTELKKQKADYDEAYFEGLKEWKEDSLVDAESVIKRVEGGKVLDVGAGTGRTVKLLKESGYDTIGIDSSDVVVKYCQDNKVNVVKGDAENLKFDDDSFDTVISTHLLEHLANPQKAIDESLRVAKKRVIHLVPLGKRYDDTHKQEYLKINDFKKLFMQYAYDCSFYKNRRDCAIVVIDKESSQGLFLDMSDKILVPDYVSIAGGTVKGSDPNDIDILIRDEQISDSDQIAVRNMFKREVWDKLHFVFEPKGPHGDYQPIADKVIRILDKPIRSVEYEKAAKEEGVGGEFGNIDFKRGMKGTGVLQLHIIGLSEEEAEKIRKNSKSLMAAARSGGKAFSIAIRKLVKAGAHIDIRLAPDGKDYWEGGEIFIGNLKGLDKLTGYKTNDKLRYQWKQSRAGERKTAVVRGALGWMEEGSRAPTIYKPGEVGALAKTWGALFRLDKFKWEAGTQEDHYKEFKYSTKLLPSGRWIYAFVPTEKGRVWMMSMPAKQEMDEPEKEGVKKAFDKRVPFIKLDDEKRLIYGIVYSPDEVDEQDDWMSSEEIEKAAHKFLIDYRRIGINHKHIVKGCKVAECYIALANMNIGDQFVKKGSWILVTRVDDDEVWQDAKDGKFTGYSIAGTARRQSEEEE